MVTGIGVAGALLAAGVSVADSSSTPALQATQILKGSSLQHSFSPAGSATSKTETLSKPDDITQLGGNLVVGFQNGVGPQGEASADGNLASTVVQFSQNGDVRGQWDVVGKVDGLTADPALNGVIATVNEDGNSSMYLIRPSDGANAVTHYTFSAALAHNGGTDAISILDGQILVSASAPGTTGAAAPSASYPAVYTVQLNASTKTAVATPLFYDEDTATIANRSGKHDGGAKTTQLALTDPDSSSVVPSGASRFAGDFMLTSQGDQQQIFVDGANSDHPRLTVLNLSQAVDDTAWPTHRSGKLFATDSTNDAVVVVTGSFDSDQPLVVATPCGANSAPASCPASPTNYLATLNPKSGNVTAVTVTGDSFVPQGGLVFVNGNH
ncbi:MAG TPA: hypothetical protein VGZ04_06600 [Acidimicrobiales bacterium]|nr:hypothetical protein [Acidimicrobiales bacterium]